MEALGKLEHTILQWLKSVPHLPLTVRRWLGANIWWIVVIGVILTGLAILGGIFTLFGNLSAFGNNIASYYASTTFLVWQSLLIAVNLVFNVVQVIILSTAITPLRQLQKKGWVLLFLSWLLGVVAAVVDAILTLNVFSFITSLIFSALFIAISGYLLFEIHGQFAHTERSKGVKASRKK